MYIDGDIYNALCRSKINNVIFATLMLDFSIICFGASIIALLVYQSTYDLLIFLIIIFCISLSFFFSIASITSYIEAYKLRKKAKELFNL